MDLDRRLLMIGLSIAALVALSIGATAWAGESSQKGYAAAGFGCLSFSAASLFLIAIVFAVNWAHRKGGGRLGLVWRYPVAVLGVLVYLFVLALLVFVESESSNPSSGYFGNEDGVMDGAPGVVIAAVVLPAILGGLLVASI